ncbi:acetate/propionate family kinase [Paludibaculum fermentans]|uniref:Acetate kinase n=2 Tax=Paludibaculum fermentans TaxID=1473598 RepID=A0A7S7SQ67_PALFE|nr:acetate/propionate family kinase [Paludibaculum fermentans]
MPANSVANPALASVLTINGGSSSIRFALFSAGDPPVRSLHGKLDRIGLGGTVLTFRDDTRDRKGRLELDSADQRPAVESILDWLEDHVAFETLAAIGHRVVHGMHYTQPTRVTRALLEELRSITPYDPEHLPREIELMGACARRHPDLAQVACFDTAFHAGMPRVARLLPIPRRFEAMGIQRYGFHGLSYTFLMDELARVAGPDQARGRVILAHLGNGASLAAVRDGHSVDTSMGFTPASGLPMGTRPGDLDPGVAWYLMQTGALTSKQFNHLVNYECGLLGVSETSSDMRDLMALQASDVRAAEAVELFCYQTRKWIGGFAAVLGGLDTLVFAGGIGENTSEVRSRACQGLQFLGIELDEARNAVSAPLISDDASRVAVRVIPTDEELMIAREVRRLINTRPEPESSAGIHKEPCNG